MMRRSTRSGSLLVAAMSIGLALAGCAPSHMGVGPGGGSGGSGNGNSGGSTSPARITGNWILESAADHKGGMNLEGSTVTLKINGRDSSGQGPCNAYGATVFGKTPARGALTFTGPVTITVGIHTEMACARQTLNELETRYFAALDDVTSASLVGDELVLLGPGVELDFGKVR
jgi:heat shock protein HslJ